MATKDLSAPQIASRHLADERKHRKLSSPEIGTRLRHARLAKGWRLKQVAAEVGCTESFLSKVENDRVRPSLAMTHRLVVALEINVAALFSEPLPDDDPVAVLKEG